MVRLRVLGELAIEVHGNPVEPPSSRAARSLLGWLALHPGLHPRSELAARFWPDVLDESARANLRNAVWALRKALGEGGAPVLVAERTRVGLDESAGLWIDRAELTRLAGSGRPEEAVELVGGELLAGAEDEWVYEARDELHAELAQIYSRLAGSAEATGDAGAAVSWTRRWAALDPVAEEPHRELMRRLAAGGDAAGALGEFDRLRGRLASQLGLAPSAVTRALADDIRAAAAAGAPAEPAPQLHRAVERIATSPLVGRRRELEALEAEWSAAAAGQGPRLSLVTGEPGIGKTRLVSELARRRHDEGALVLYGRADEQGFVSYEPFVEALGHYLSWTSPMELGARLGADRAVLARILPQLGAEESGSAVAPDRARFEAFEALARMMQRLSEARPLLLVLDDLHWSDGPTAMLLKHLLRSPSRMRAMVVGAYRGEEVEPASLLARTLADLGRDLSPRTIELAGLDPDQVTELLASRWQAVDAELAAAVYERTRGNPLFVSEMMRALGNVDPGAASSAAVRAAEVPAAISDLIGRRLERLDDDCRELLSVAAVAGHVLDLRVIERAAAMSGARLADALEHAVLAAIVSEADGARGYAFAHPLFREALSAGMSGPRRAALHLRVAEALEEAHPRSASHLTEIAGHRLAAGEIGDVAVAADSALRAGRAAEQRMAYEEAASLYGSALRLIGDSDPERRTALMRRRAVALQAAMHLSRDYPTLLARERRVSG